MTNNKGLFKIGRSNNPKIRLLDIEFETGFNIELLKVWKNKGTDEKQLHKDFNSKVERFYDLFDTHTREWFKLDKKDISTIFNNYGT